MKICGYKPCAKPLIKKPGESTPNFELRRHCNRHCRSKHKSVATPYAQMLAHQAAVNQVLGAWR